MSTKTLSQLLQRPDLWQGRFDHAAPRGRRHGLASGHKALDQALHHNGWPRYATTELLLDTPGIGEWRLLSPTLARLSHDGWLLLINPPYQPYGPALAMAGIDIHRLLVLRPRDLAASLWCCQQALKDTSCAAVLCWFQGRQQPDYSELRRLQLAAANGHSHGFLFRPHQLQQQHSPCALRLLLDGQNRQLNIEVIKQRGGNAGQKLSLPLPGLLQAHTALNQLPGYQNRPPSRRPLTELPSAPRRTLYQPTMRLPL